jgi:hypothetical protein
MSWIFTLDRLRAVIPKPSCGKSIPVEVEQNGEIRPGTIAPPDRYHSWCRDIEH